MTTERLERASEVRIRVDETLRRLREVTRNTTLETALEIGRVVISTLYNGDCAEWRQRRRGGASLRELVRRPDLPMSAASLYRAIALYELCERTGATSFRHLGASHLRAVLGVPIEHQRALLETAEREHWTVTGLEAAAAALASPSRARGGRRRVATYVRTLRALERLTTAEALEGLDRAAQLDSLEANRLRCSVERMLERLKLVHAALGARPGRGAAAVPARPAA